MVCRENATLIEYQTRKAVAGSTQIANDDWIWQLKISDSELLNAQVLLTAKMCVDDPDDRAEIRLSSYATGDSAIANVIEILESSTANRLDAFVRVPSTRTNIEIPMGLASVGLYFDVQVVRAGTPVTSPKKQTYFRSNNSMFHIIRDITVMVPSAASPSPSPSPSPTP